jgi:hypothetical protein
MPLVEKAEKRSKEAEIDVFYASRAVNLEFIPAKIAR